MLGAVVERSRTLLQGCTHGILVNDASMLSRPSELSIDYRRLSLLEVDDRKLFMTPANSVAYWNRKP